jgi:hypothetical protein
MAEEIKFPSKAQVDPVPQRMCASCAAWQPPPAESGQQMGQCRRHPPTPFLMQVKTGNIVGVGGGHQPNVQPTIISAWPPSPPNGGCMDWMPEEQKATP